MAAKDKIERQFCSRQQSNKAAGAACLPKTVCKTQRKMHTDKMSCSRPAATIYQRKPKDFSRSSVKIAVPEGITGANIPGKTAHHQLPSVKPQPPSSSSPTAAPVLVLLTLIFHSQTHTHARRLKLVTRPGSLIFQVFKV